MKDEKALEQLSDDELILRYLSGEDRSFTVLFKRHMPLVRRLARKGASSEAEAEDLCMESLEHLAFRLRKEYRPSGHFPAWLRRVVGNFVTSFHRKRNPARRPLPLSLSCKEDSRTQFSLRLQEWVYDELKALMPLLPVRQQVLVQMKFWEGMSYREISDLLAIRRTTVIYHTNAACRKLRKMLEEKEIGPELG